MNISILLIILCVIIIILILFITFIHASISFYTSQQSGSLQPRQYINRNSLETISIGQLSPSRSRASISERIPIDIHLSLPKTSSFKLRHRVSKFFEPMSASPPNFNMQGSSTRIEYDVGDHETLEHPQEIHKQMMQTFDQQHNHFLHYICSYINSQNPLPGSETLIVGDVHGSLLQLFMPLKKAGLIRGIEYYHNSTKPCRFSCEPSLTDSTSSVIYCGDMFGRAKHSLTVDMIITFIDTINLINKRRPNSVIWVYGNHDTSFIRGILLNGTRISDVEASEYDEIINSPNLKFLKTKMLEMLKSNEYPCIYYSENSNIQVSHTFIANSSYYLETNNFLPTNRVYGLPILYSLFNDEIPTLKRLFESYGTPNFDNELTAFKRKYSIYSDQKNTDFELMNLIVENKIRMYSRDGTINQEKLKESEQMLEQYSDQDIPAYLFPADVRQKTLDDNRQKMRKYLDSLKDIPADNPMFIKIYDAFNSSSLPADHHLIINFINNFAKYFLFLNLFPQQAFFDEEFYRLRPYTSNKKVLKFAVNNKYYKVNPDTQYFIGHTTMFINGGIEYSKIVDEANELFETYKYAVDEYPFPIYKQHEDYLKVLMRMSVPDPDTLARYLFDKNFINALIIGIINRDHIFNNFFNNSKATYESRTVLSDKSKIDNNVITDNNLYFMDIGATFPITPIDNLKSDQFVNAHIYDEYAHNPRLPMVEIGFHTSCFAILNNARKSNDEGMDQPKIEPSVPKVVASRVYLF